MDISDFTEAEKLALLELLILGMYADSHLALAEEAQVQKVLDAFEFTTKQERYDCMDAAVTRVRVHADNFEEATAYASHLAGQFSTLDRRLRAFQALDAMVAANRKVNEDQKRFLAAVQKMFES